MLPYSPISRSALYTRHINRNKNLIPTRPNPAIMKAAPGLYLHATSALVSTVATQTAHLATHSESHGVVQARASSAQTKCWR